MSFYKRNSMQITTIFFILFLQKNKKKRRINNKDLSKYKPRRQIVPHTTK